MEELPRTHSGVINRAGEILCKKGKISKEIAKRLKKALKDYDAEIDEKDASEILSLAKELQKLFQFK